VTERAATSEGGRAMARRGGRATLADVAARAGVSPSTVSRVVRRSTPVSAELEQAVLDAIAATGYVPNLAARQLVTTRSDTVGMIVAEDQRRVFGEPFFGALMHGVVEMLAETRFHVVVVVARSTHDRVWLEHYVAGGHLDGVMLIAPPRGDPLASTLSRLGVPMVYIGRPFAVTDCTYVDADNAGGAAQAVRHLYETGRRRIAMVTGIPAMRSATDRLRGYRKGLAAAGLEADPGLMIASDYTEAGGWAAMRELLARGHRFDAVVAASDLVAGGVLRALNEAGRTVPDDVALIGFGDEGQTAALYDPPLTTVAQPTVEMGGQLARLTVAAIEGDGQRRSVIMPTRLVVRSSA
jgi:DNA-binding LacI/PurR family transcriptional regulator